MDLYVPSDEHNTLEEIGSLPGQFRVGLDQLDGYLAPLVAKGLASVLLFGVPSNVKKASQHPSLLFIYGLCT